MLTSIELQVISKLLTTESEEDIDILTEFDASYYSVFKPHIEFILNHRQQYGNIPDVFTFQSEFPDITLVAVREPIEFLCREMQRNKQHILLLETFNKLKDLGSGDITQAWAYLSRQCDKAAELDQSKPMDLIKDAKQRSDEVLEYSRQTRIPTGFAEIDKLMYGGLSTVEELLLIIARTNTGKAQPLWAPVLTPLGWTTMGNLKVGDIVIGENNDNGHVVQIFPQGEKEYYRIHFDDGTFAECCDDHLWKVLSAKRRERANKNYGIHEVLTTRDLRNNIQNRYSIDISSPIEFESDFDESNELDGYLLGLLIGDGSLRDGRVLLTNASDEIWNSVEKIIPKYNCIRSSTSRESIIACPGQPNYIRRKLVEYGLLNVKSIDKFIPKQYLTAPIHVRMALLSGLMDTDGYAPKGSKQLWEFDTASEQLATDFAELARSLGVAVKVHPRKPSYYKQNGIQIQAAGSYHLTCRSEFNPFRLSTKASRFNVRTEPYKHSMPKRHCKMIQSIEYVGKTACQCIMLDNVSHTYLTSDYTGTHNTWVLTKMMESAQKAGFPVLYYSPEMQASYLGTRFDTWRNHYQNSQLIQGRYTEQYLDYLTKLSQEETSAFVLEDKDMSSGEVNTQGLETFVKRHGIKLLIIDGLSYMSDTKRGDTDYIRYKNICLDLFKLSKKHRCAVVVALQANRETHENKDDKGVPFPDLRNVEGSDHPARIATQAFSLRQIFDKHVLDIRLEKSRMANNQKPVLSYAWDVNTGNMQYLPGGDDDPVSTIITPPSSFTNLTTTLHSNNNVPNESEFDEVEF